MSLFWGFVSPLLRDLLLYATVLGFISQGAGSKIVKGTSVAHVVD
jgi:hypothetical protein